MKRSKGTLSTYTRRLKAERKLTANDFIKDFEEGERVVIDVQPYYKEGMPHPRYNGRVARVVEKRGSHYVVLIKDGSKEKKLISHPVHLKKLKSKKAKSKS